jgi:hypothetical protein
MAYPPGTLNSINGTNLPTEVTNFPAALDVQAGAMPGETQASPAPISPVSVSPVSVSTTAAVPASACGFALFGDTSCFTIGSVSIGQTTALVLGAAIVALFLMGGNR